MEKIKEIANQLHDWQTEKKDKRAVILITIDEDEQNIGGCMAGSFERKGLALTLMIERDKEFKALASAALLYDMMNGDGDKKEAEETINIPVSKDGKLYN